MKKPDEYKIVESVVSIAETDIFPRTNKPFGLGQGYKDRSLLCCMAPSVF